MSEAHEAGKGDEAAGCPRCSGKTKVRSPDELKALVNRLNRIEGQVKGVKAMLLSDAYCIDILVQVSAVRSALNSFAKEIIAQHIKTCVADGIKEGRGDVVDELIATVQKLIR